MQRGAKLFVKGGDGNPCGPFRWTAVREWVTIGFFTPADEVRLVDDTTWRPIVEIPELLAKPPGADSNEALKQLQSRAREKKAVGPRAAAYLRILGCPVPPSRLNPFTARQWIGILEELRPQLANATERWAADEESDGRVPSASPDDATPGQLEKLRAIGYSGPDHLTLREARRLISGPPGDEQLRRLRFYGITLPAGAGKEEASELIDRYMREHWETEEVYQAHRKSLMTEVRGRQEPAIAPTTGQPPLAATTGIAATPTESPTAIPNADEAADPRPRRSPFGRSILGLGLAALLVLAIIWSVAKRISGTSVAEPAPFSSQSPEPEVPTYHAQPGRGPLGEPETPQQIRRREFETFVMALKLTGVFGGSEPRASIDGRNYRVGDVVDRPRGVVILRVDAVRLSVVFGDKEENYLERFLQ